MDPETLIGGLIVTVIGGVAVLLIERWLQRHRSGRQTHNEEKADPTPPIPREPINSLPSGEEENSGKVKPEPSEPSSLTEEANSMDQALTDSSAVNLSSCDIALEYVWHSPHSIVVRSKGREYFLQGLNAAIFVDLADSPLLYQQLPADQSKKQLIEYLAVALATIDRQYSEPATTTVIEALWLKEKRTGIKRFVDLLARRQWKDSRWEGYRDHLNHMLKVYLTGLYLYKNCHSLRDTLLGAANCEEEEFLRRWLYASTFHDVGYIFELPGPERIIENLKFVQEHVQNFLHYHDLDLADELTRAGLKQETIDLLHAEEVMSTIGLRLRPFQGIDDLGTVWGSDFDLWSRLNALCKGTGIGDHGIRGYLDLCLTQSPPMVSGRPPFHDHGIIGAIILLHIGYAQRAIFQGLDKGLQPTQPLGVAPLEKTGRSAVLSKMVEWAGDLDSHVATIEQASVAIALHNICKDAWRPEEIPWQVDLANYWISVFEYPLAFTLVLADVLQNWDRPGFNPAQPGEEQPLQGRDLDIRSDGEKILLGYLDRPDEYGKTIDELKKVLSPGQVDMFVAPLDVEKLRAGSPLVPGPVRHHNQRVVNKLRGDWFNRFIELYMIPMRLRTESGGTEVEQYTILEIADRFPETPVAILGEPGAGKTTLVEMLAIQYAENGPRVPIFISMRMYSGQDDLREMFDIAFDNSLLTDFLNRGRFLIIFDGLNEVSLNLREPAARAIAWFIDKYPSNQFFITCRTAEYPPYLRAPALRFEVMPVGPDIVREYLVEFLGSGLGIEVCNSLPPQVRDLCRNPLLLTMLTYIYTGERPREAPVSKAALYKQFLEQLYAREEELRSIELTQQIREEFLRHLAISMKNESTSVKRGDAQHWISDLYRRDYLGTGYRLPAVFHEVLDLPPMKAVQPGWHGADIELSFMHQSFQEYYTACELLMRLAQGDASVEDISVYASPENEHWWETLSLLGGMMVDATPLIREIKQRAESTANLQGDQRSFTLVARCIREASSVDPAEVDDVIIRTLLAFKFGKVPFDYNLIYGLKLIRPEQRSPDFPTRLIEDVNWWLDKYARASAAKLDKDIPIDILLGYIESDDEGLVLDALFTLRDHEAKDQAVSALVKRLQHSTDTIREQVIATLGYLERDALPAVIPLIEVVRNPRETKWARAFALNALGKIGDARAVPAMIEYMLDHANPYRDSASWGLQYIAKRNASSMALQDQLRKAYIEALLSETEDLEGRYAKGNIVYSLGELKATEYVDHVVQWLKGETDPYVLEDSIQAVGQLKDPKAWDISVAHLSNEDPVVRMMAIGALLSIACASEEKSRALPFIQPLLDDRTAIVRECAKKAVESLRGNAEM